MTSDRISLKEIEKARQGIKPFIHKTPLVHSNSFSTMTGAEVYLKAENLQKTGSFKVRGAFNKLLSLQNGRIIAASMGNHAQGIAFAAKRLGMGAKIVMPVSTPIVKETATKNYGAEVLLHGDSFSDALDYALSQKGYTFIHAFDDEKIIAGQGTIGLEILDDLNDIDCVVVPIGGGGLIAGISTAVKALSPETEIIGVQTEAAGSAYASFGKEIIYEQTPLPTIADGIAVGRVGEKTIKIINNLVDDVVLVSEESIARALLLFLERKKLVVEGAGAAALAALIENSERFSGKRTVLLVSGGNIDFTLIDRIIHKGLVSSGRIGVFEAIVDDSPGSLHSLTGIIASHRANILNVVHSRLTEDLPVVKTRVVFTIEIREKNHLDSIISDLAKKGYKALKI